MGFVEAVKTCFEKRLTFSGRASRSEFWYFHMFNVFVRCTIVVIFCYASNLLSNNFEIILIILLLTALNPNLSASVRRFHDINRSGWFVLWIYAFTIPFIILIILSAVPILNSILPKDPLMTVFIAFVVASIISVVVSIYLTILLSRKGTVGDNRFGPDPLQPRN